MRYGIIASTDIGILVNEVDNKMKEGWAPQGGISVRTISCFESELVQAMVKIETKG
jgi:hypothetical protein